jgi:hypothetical protein
MPAVRAILTLAATGAIAAAALAGPTAATASPKPANLVVTHIHCVSTEDVTGPDEALLKWHDGNTIWSGQLNDGNEVDTPHVVVHVGDTIDLWDVDSPDPDDLLGSLRIDGAHDYHYTNGADYWVTIANE